MDQDEVEGAAGVDLFGDPVTARGCPLCGGRGSHRITEQIHSRRAFRLVLIHPSNLLCTAVFGIALPTVELSKNRRGTAEGVTPGRTPLRGPDRSPRRAPHPAHA